ncbi:MAG: non-ribosomal peptide synthetase, partial [Lachnospiraceae bacterium]|nr:non-ribosomal peptide synthetase [Lachnospiraceae bacterium]
IVLGDEKDQSNPRAIVNLIKENQVDTVQMTPSRLQMILNYDETLGCMKNVRVIMVGGEALPESMLKKLQAYTAATIYNMYGPTEATIWCGVSNLTGKKAVDIGRAINNAEMMILREDLSPVTDGEIGEICIAGNVLATRYIGEEELTGKAFVYLRDEQEKRIYKTGDMGYYLLDGCIKYVGRKDNQIKVHGYRVELEEIEACANGYDGTERTLACYNPDVAEGIILYYTSEVMFDANELSLYLKSRLPQYMIPIFYYRVEKFMYTPNGKIDRKRVKECKILAEYIFSDYTEDTLTADVIHKDVKETVSEYLKEKIDVAVEYETRLERLGIDSLTFIRLIVFLEEKYGFMFDDDKLVISAFPSIYDLGDYIKIKMESV